MVKNNRVCFYQSEGNLPWAVWLTARINHLTEYRTAETIGPVAKPDKFIALDPVLSDAGRPVWAGSELSCR